MNRTSYVVLPPLDGNQKHAVLQHIHDYRPALVVFVNDSGLAVEATDVSPETRVIFRHYHPDDSNLFETISANDYASYITLNGALDKRIWVYIWNEPDTRPNKLPDLVNKTLQVVDIVEAWGYRAVVGNIGTATIELNTIASGVFDPLLLRAATWPHLMAYHTYTAVLVPFGVGYWSMDDLKDPANVQPIYWPEIETINNQRYVVPGYRDFASIDDMLADLMSDDPDGYPISGQTDVTPEPGHYWHIFREEWLQARAVEIGAGRHDYVILEGLLDRMPDISGKPDNIYTYLEQTYGVPDNTGGEIRGAPTLEYVWRAWWPDWSFDEALWQQCHWMERNAPDECLGWCWFAWVFDRFTNKEQRWEPGYNIGDRPDFKSLLTRNRDVPAKPPGPSPSPDPDPPPEPLPDAPHWMLLFFVGVIGVILGAILYSFIQPQLAAQGVYPMEGIMNITEAGELLVAMVAAVIAGGAAAPVFTPLVNLVKLILKLVGLEDKVTGQTINAWVAALVVIVAWFSQHWGMEVEAQTVMDWLVMIIPPVVTGIALFTGNKYVYETAQKLNLPLWKYQRSA
jgi:hypothetical protein